MINFKEGQEKIFVGKNKLQNSFNEGFLDYHIVYMPDEKSGYGNMVKDKFVPSKFVRIITFENIYDFEIIRALATNSFDDELPIKYFENGGYEYDKKSF